MKTKLIFPKLMLVVLSFLLMISDLMAQTVEFSGSSSSPANPYGLELRDETIPPLPGVELFVFNPTGFSFPPNDAPYGTEYTLNFNVAKQPASVVAIPGNLTSYQFSENSSGDPDFPHQLILTFVHQEYAGGVAADLPGPVGDFAVAFIPVDDEVPAALAGSWMSTNISPLSWQIIPPSPEDLNFGYNLSGPVGATAFFDLFIPDSMMEYLSTLSGELVEAEDLALFNNNDQVSVGVEAVPSGALVGVDVVFSQTSNDVLEDDDLSDLAMTRAGAEIGKDLTVGRAEDVSINASNKQVKKGKKAKIYGWVKDGLFGEKVKISSTYLKSIGKPFTFTRKLDAEGKFTFRPVINANDVFRATFKKTGGATVKSRKLKIKSK